MADLLKFQITRKLRRRLSGVIQTGLLEAHGLCFSVTRTGLIGGAALLAPLGMALIPGQGAGAENRTATMLVDTCPAVTTHDVLRTGLPSSPSPVSTSTSPPGCNLSRL